MLLYHEDVQLGEKVIDVYVLNLNYGMFLKDCLMSVTRHGLNPILLDGGSSDNSVEIAKQLGVKVMVFDSDKGKRFNYAVESFDSKYLMFMASDNILLDGFTKKTERFLESHSKYGVAYGYAIPISESGKRIGAFLHGGVFFRDRLHFSNFIDYSEALIRRESLTGLHMPNRFYSPDWFMWLYASSCGWKFKNLFMPSILYRIHSRQLSKTLPRYVLENEKDFLKETFGKEKFRILDRAVVSLSLAFQKSLGMLW